MNKIHLKVRGKKITRRHTHTHKSNVLILHKKSPLRFSVKLNILNRYFIAANLNLKKEIDFYSVGVASLSLLDSN